MQFAQPPRIVSLKLDAGNGTQDTGHKSRKNHTPLTPHNVHTMEITYAVSYFRFRGVSRPKKNPCNYVAGAVQMASK